MLGRYAATDESEEQMEHSIVDIYNFITIKFYKLSNRYECVKIYYVSLFS